MQRYDFHYRQKVNEAELDAAFDACEQAEQRQYTDLGMVGILIGASVNEYSTPNLTVDVSAGVVVDQTGQRIRWSSIQNVDCSVDENSTSTAVTTPGNSKYLSIFAKFLRVNSDPRVDGEQNTVFFNRAESFELRVAQGAEAASPSPPALRSDQILLADILIAYGQTTIQDTDIDMVTRREWAIQASSAVVTVARGNTEDAVQDLADAIATGSTAAGTSYSGGPNWNDGTTNPATTVEAQLDKIISDLADETTLGNGGGDKVGVAAQSSGSFAVTDGSIYDQTGELLAHIATVNTFANSGNWHDGTGIAATEIEAAVNEVKNDLASDTSSGGADKIGAGAQSFQTTALTAGSIYDQLMQLMKIFDIWMRYLRASNFALYETTDVSLLVGDQMHKVIWETVNDQYVAVGYNTVSPTSSAFVTTSRTLESWSSKKTLSGGTPEIFYDAIEITDAAFSSNRFMAVGQEDSTPTDAAVYGTTDPGSVALTKRTTSSLTIESIRNIAYDSSGGYAIVVGEDSSNNGAIARSADGSSWSNATTVPSAGTLYSVAADTSGNIIAVGSQSGGTNGIILKSANAGVTWTSKYTSTDSLRCVVWDAQSGDFYVASVGNGVILRSTDNGDNWAYAFITSAADARRPFNAIATDGNGMITMPGDLLGFVIKHGPDGTASSNGVWVNMYDFVLAPNLNGGSFVQNKFIFTCPVQSTERPILAISRSSPGWEVP